ncbi:response regulator transcription factor [Caldicellulosiruptoraceae bacterium PP1]
MYKHIIYIVDDEKEILNFVSTFLSQRGYIVKCFENASSFLITFYKEQPDLVILDIMLPDVDGYEVLRELRKTSQVPVIMLSAKSEEFDKVLGLELGSDDYMSKPFSLAELEARIRKTLRRTSGDIKKPNDESIEIKGLEIDQKKKVVNYIGEELNFTPKEYEVFYLLYSERDKVLKRSFILENVWGDPSLYDERMVDDVIKRIRKKLNAQNVPIEIKTMWGLGYRLEEKKDEDTN